MMMAARGHCMEIRLEEYKYYIRPRYTDMRKGSASLDQVLSGSGCWRELPAQGISNVG